MNDDEYILLATQKAKAVQDFLDKYGWSKNKTMPDYQAGNTKLSNGESLADKVYDLLQHLLS